MEKIRDKLILVLYLNVKGLVGRDVTDVLERISRNFALAITRLGTRRPGCRVALSKAKSVIRQGWQNFCLVL